MGLASTAGARIPHVAGDPFYGLVLLLLTGRNGITTDSSIYNRGLATVGSPAIDSAKTLNGLPTYRVPSGSRIDLTVSDAWVAGNLAAGEWCWEFYFNPDNVPTTLSGRMWSFGQFTVSWEDTGRLTWAASNIGSSSYTVQSALGAVPANSWRHVCLIRDNTTNPLFTVLRLFLDGVQVDGIGGFNKTDAVGGVGFQQVLGYGSDGTPGAYGGMRLTAGTRRYMTNAEGGAVGTFTPSTYPFWAPPP